MAEYLMRLIGMTLVVSVVGAIAPQRAKKHVRLLSSLCLICVIAMPLSEIDMSEIFDGEYVYSENAEAESIYVEIYNNTISEANEERISEELKKMIVSKVGADSEDISVSVETEMSEAVINITSVSVGLGGKNLLLDPRSVTSYIEEMLGCKCEIYYY